jgi:integrase/recombinase XerC
MHPTLNLYHNTLSNFNTGLIFNNLDVSYNTRKEYKSRLPVFLHFIKLNGFNTNSFLEFKRFLGERTDLSVSSKNKYLITSKVFLKELCKQRYLESDITINVKGFIQNKLHKKDGLFEDEISKIMEYCQILEVTPQNIRLKAILALLTLQGLRQIEIIRLNVSNLNIRSGIAHIQGKGNDDTQPIYLHPKTIKILSEYIKVCKIKDGPLFQSFSNNNKNRRLTTKSIREIIKTLLNSLAIQKDVHGFRHYFTTKLIKSYKGDLLMVSKYTRHKTIEMLQVYNDQIIMQEDLPKYYDVFKDLKF